MVKRTQTIRRLLPTNCLSLFDHFVGLALKGLKNMDFLLVNLQIVQNKYSLKKCERLLLNF